MAKSKKRSDASVSNSSNHAAPANGSAVGTVDRDRVARRAYELYLARGGSHGADWEDWLAAERELMNASGGERRQGGRER